MRGFQDTCEQDCGGSRWRGSRRDQQRETWKGKLCCQGRWKDCRRTALHEATFPSTQGT